MGFVKYDGEYIWARELQEYLNDKLTYLHSVFPKITDHIEGNKIIIKDNFHDNKQVLGYYLPNEKNIYIIAGNIKSRISALHCLIHEIGHAIQDKRKGIDPNYDSEKQNVVYWREEIKAESYALQIFVRFLEVGNVVDHVKSILRYLYKGLEEAKEKTTSIYPYTTSTGNYGWYIVGNSYSTNVSVSGSWFSWSSYSSSVTWNCSVQYVNDSIKLRT